VNETVHTHDEDGDCVYIQQRPVWSFSWWDMAGVATFLVAGVLKTVGAGLDALGREFSAAANFERDQKTLHEQRIWYAIQQRQREQEMRAFLHLPEADPENIPEAER